MVELKKDLYYKCIAKDLLNAKIPLNSTFDETLKDEDLRIVETIEESEDEETAEIKEEHSFDIECYSQRLGKEIKWESVIKYPTFVSGHKTTTEYNNIQHKIKALIKK